MKVVVAATQLNDMDTNEFTAPKGPGPLEKRKPEPPDKEPQHWPNGLALEYERDEITRKKRIRISQLGFVVFLIFILLIIMLIGGQNAVALFESLWTKH